MSASAGGGRLDGSDRVGPSETRTCQHFTRTDFLTGSLNAPDRFWRCDACGVEGIYPPELDDPKDAIYLSYLAADHAAQVAASSETVEYALRTVAVLGYERALSRVGPAPSGLRWQPIASAPKDGTYIDIWAKAWLPAFDRFEFKRFADCTWMKGDSMCNRPPYWLNLDKDWHPTHWMPLPDPPADVLSTLPEEEKA
jgi:hypothetical protein